MADTTGDSSPTSPSAAGGLSAANNADKPRLSEQEKKSNHIASEQKRRQAIREGFDEIASIVPGLEGQGRSEATVLAGATAFIRGLLVERHNLIQQARANGVDTKQWELDDQTMRFAVQANANTADQQKS